MSKQSRRPGRRKRKRATYQTRPVKSGGPKHEYTNHRRGKTVPVDPGSTDETGKHNRAHGPTPVTFGWLPRFRFPDGIRDSMRYDVGLDEWVPRYDRTRGAALRHQRQEKDQHRNGPEPLPVLVRVIGR